MPATALQRDNVAVIIGFRDGSVANLLYAANGDRAVAKEYFEVFCGGSIARIDDFKALCLSRDGKTETLRGVETRAIAGSSN
jgi:polar amino acid transport system substrate-binding protein